ncbi:MAG: NUDIX domain-containing protein [Anaerolineae bacterium]|jgi:8-oxo-dGTP diphosphatase|nr:NUDIX domain-containing protein [Anaerolineae bacterium]
MGLEDQHITNDRYLAIPRTLIFIFDREHVLLIHGAPDKHIWANRYNGVGGHVEPGENIYCAAIRELAEETSLHDTTLHMAGIIHVKGDGNTGVIIFVFYGTYHDEAMAASSEGRLEWVPVANLDKYSVVEDLPLIIPEVLQCRANGGLFYGETYYDRSDNLKIEFVRQERA